LGIDPGADTSFGANRLLLREHRVHLENLGGLCGEIVTKCVSAMTQREKVQINAYSQCACERLL